MLPANKVQLFNVVKELKIDPKEFHVQETTNAFTLRLLGSSLFFTVLSKENTYAEMGCKYQTYAPQNPVHDLSYTTLNIKQLIAYHFRKWLVDSVRLWIENRSIQDPWLLIEQDNKTFLEDLQSDQNTFNAKEQEELKNVLESYKHLIQAKFNISSAQAEIVDEKLDRLLEAAKTQTKADWKMFSYGVIASIVTTLGFDHDQGVSLYNLFVEAFKVVGPLFKSLPPGP
jgi:hypothetical protein